MSKNFELLHNISNEKDLFQTLDRWEDTEEAAVHAEPEVHLDGKAHAKPQRQSLLPDVFQAIDDSLGPLDLVTPGLSRNPITRLNSDLDISQAWVKPEIGLEPRDEVEVALKPETPPSSANAELQPIPGRASNPSGTKAQEPSPAQEEKPHPQLPRSRPFGNLGVGDGKSASESRTRKGRTRGVYRDPGREAIAREEELKLVQRIFLAEENSPRMVLFSGFERDTGCASICVRAGELLASQGEDAVCLVDMGFRAPSLHEYCGVKNDKGLAEALVESGSIQEFAQQLSPANLWVIPAGYGAPQLNFTKTADRLRARTEELRKAFRYVVVHCGSLWLNADAMLISKWTDGMVLILEAHSTRRDAARRIKESLAAANARVLGVVLNNRTYPIPETLYSRL